ncbi:hypothetical protein HZ326_20834 [Fusarium oxysporum f. sp. albedinis]|nr:hypothetical protein HZ326_20834 [Fusarium oxysporum f. sp. albedinis]
MDRQETQRSKIARKREAGAKMSLRNLQRWASVGDLLCIEEDLRSQRKIARPCKDGSSQPTTAKNKHVQIMMCLLYLGSTSPQKGGEGEKLIQDSK